MNSLIQVLSSRFGGYSGLGRLIRAGGVKVNGLKVTDTKREINIGDEIQVGRHIKFTVRESD
jgi:RNA-binding protein YlmH